MTHRARRWAVVLAAGRGERFGAGVPKQYRRLLGRTVLEWSLGALLAERRIDAVLVALAPGDRRWARLEYAEDPRVMTCEGGTKREHSLRAALDALQGRADDRDWIVVHDAARPCLRAEDLARLLNQVGGDPVGGLLAVPLSDTLKRADRNGRSRGTVGRESLWRALTPQMFRYGVLRRGLALCVDRERAVTDVESAVECLGLRPLLVRGRTDNIKITHAEDLAIADALLRAGRPRR